MCFFFQYIEIFLNQVVYLFDKLISPLEIFGAGFVIFLLAVLVVQAARDVVVPVVRVVEVRVRVHAGEAQALSR